MNEQNEIIASDSDERVLNDLLTKHRQPLVIRGLVDQWPLVQAAKKVRIMR